MFCTKSNIDERMGMGTPFWKYLTGRGTVPQNWGPGGHFRLQPFSGIWQTKKSSVRLG